jgi:KUP system potassium uptake protein
MQNTEKEPVLQRDLTLFPLVLGSLGVVFGDIGTSPLYAIREIFHGLHAIPATTTNIFGILSLIFWLLNLVISYKYISLIMRANNEGEGGIMALLALALRASVGARFRKIVIGLGLFGTALFYSDGMLTPAISILSAVEGLKIIPNQYEDILPLKKLVIPLSVVILIKLFSIQHKGTKKVGFMFGPIMVVWFVTLAVLGIINIAKNPSILKALNPLYAWHFLTSHFWANFLALGAVALVLTGAEALYADMGHFGRKPIRFAWFSLVMPALVLNYFGQGALILRHPEAISNPFYLLAPHWALYPLVLLATCATVIASQAIISGAFSVTHQAIQLGYLPRLRCLYTSDNEGQIYIPVINWGLMMTILLLVVIMHSSSRLASAYGIAVLGTMVITTLLALFVIHYRWRLSWSKGIAIMVFFFLIDSTLLLANFEKISKGGWFPLVFALLIFTVMLTWKTGQKNLTQKIKKQCSIEEFAERMATGQAIMVENQAIMPARIQGTAIFLTSNLNAGIPQALVNNLKHNKVLHQRVIFLTGHVEDVPFIQEELKRIEITQLAENCYQIIISYGFHQHPDIKRLLDVAEKYLNFDYNVNETSFFLSKETLLAKDLGMSDWQAQIFAFLFRNASNPVAFFNLPPHRVVEVGEQIRV